MAFNFLFFQLWDIRDGMCKQTFPGHESDINAVTVTIHLIWPFLQNQVYFVDYSMAFMAFVYIGSTGCPNKF